MPGDRDRIRQFAAISLLDLLRRRLLESLDPGPAGSSAEPDAAPSVQPG